MRNVRRNFLLAILLAAPALAADPAPPPTLAYQGRLLEGSAPVTGDRSFTFAILDAAGNQVWHSGPQTLTVNGGLYSAVLGSAGMPPMPAEILGRAGLKLHVTLSGLALVPDVDIIPGFQARSAWEVTGDFAGDLTGTQGQTQVAGLQGYPLDLTTTAPMAGQTLVFDGVRWASSSIAGVAGPAGAEGPAGAHGPIGPAGETGAAGAQGPIGPAGATGAAGARGPIGLTGATGLAGAQGPVGLTGTTGPAGAQGPIGLTGVMGPLGPMGLTGSAGPAGATGATGPQGATGLAGATGSPGPAGSTGATGAAGGIGPQGLTGPAGATGAAGPQGLQGPAGPAGSSGAVLGSYKIGTDHAFAVAFDGTSIWTANSNDITVTRINAANPAIVATYTVGSMDQGWENGANPIAVAFDGASIWVSLPGMGSVASSVKKLNIADGTVAATCTGTNNPAAMAFDGANIWCANNTTSGTVSRR